MLTDEQYIRYQRQLSLPEVGEIGQKSLINSHVLIIGCGGLGSASILYLAAAGVGRLVISDDDFVETSNLQRQVIYRSSNCSKKKVLAVSEQVRDINPDCKVRTIDKRMELEQLSLEVMLADIVLDCSDNMPTRQLVNLACLSQKKPLVTAAASGWQGQFSVFDYQNEGPCYRCLYPFNELDGPGSCTENGIAGPVVGIMGNLQALAAIQKLASGSFQSYRNRLLIFDGLNMEWQSIEVSKDRLCETCSKMTEGKTEIQGAGEK